MIDRTQSSNAQVIKCTVEDTTEGHTEGHTAEGAGGNMVFVKVRETYDLHTTKNKMTVIGIHTPKPDIIKRNYPGLLMQCRAYRPVSVDVAIACASVLPLDPQGVGLTENDVAPEDVFNPILYKPMSNKGMSQLEARINQLQYPAAGQDVDGDTACVDVDSVTSKTDEFGIYYGLLSNTHDWKHANPQSGLSMRGIKPYVYEMNYSIGDQPNYGLDVSSFPLPGAPSNIDTKGLVNVACVLGKAKPFPFLNCTSYTAVTNQTYTTGGYAAPGFTPGSPAYAANAELDVPYLPVVCAAIIVPPSRLHELFYRMTVVWTLEFSGIRPLSEITDWHGLERIGNATHFQNYSYSKVKEALTGTEETILENDACMVSSNVEVNKVM